MSFSISSSSNPSPSCKTGSGWNETCGMKILGFAGVKLEGDCERKRERVHMEVEHHQVDESES